MQAFKRVSLVFIASLWLSTTGFAAESLDNHFETLRTSNKVGEIREAEARIWQAWLTHPHPDVARLMQAGVVRMNSGRLEEALLVFNELVERFPEYMEAWNKRATLFYLLGDFNASVADIDRTLALEPRHFGALSGLSLIHIQQNEMRLARDVLLRLLEIHPNSPNARQNLELVETALQRQLI